VIRALVVDDEPLAREGVRRALAGESDVLLVGEAVDGPGACEAILHHRPDLLFLDVQIPGFDGFEVVRRVRDLHLPTIVFVSAFDHYALAAFEVHAIDYLLKPFTDERFAEALEHARRRLATSPSVPLAHLLEWLSQRGPESPRFVDRFTVKDHDAYRLVRAEEIDWIESAGNYAQLWVGDRFYLVRTTLNRLESSLDPRRFARIHRTAILNIDRVREVRPDPTGDFSVVLTDGRTLRLSRRYRERLLG